MWQFLLAAAAAAGSGFFAKRVFSKQQQQQPFNDSEETDVQSVSSPAICTQFSNRFCGIEETDVKSVSSPGFCTQIPNGFSEIDEKSTALGSTLEEGMIFRFASLGCDDLDGSRKKQGSGSKRLKGRRVKTRSGVDEEVEESSSLIDEEQRKKGRGFSVCLKKRRVRKNAMGKCGSCSSEGGSLFSWGLGVGIMHMMSACKAEINKLTAAVDETAKVVRELERELHKRKSMRDLQHSNCKDIVDTSQKGTVGLQKQLIITKLGGESEDPDHTEASCVPIDDGECASSVLTEEPERQVLDMDELEAELEFELQKIPWCNISQESSANDERISDLSELDSGHPVEFVNTQISAHGLPAPHEPEGTDADPSQFHGVLPSELDQKLCHLLIEQQEFQILELKSKLHSTQTKLNEKETQLQAVKSNVRRLTLSSLETASDEESEKEMWNMGGERAGGSDLSTSTILLAGVGNERGPTEQKSMVGMKRAIEFDSCDCNANTTVSVCRWRCV